MDLNCKCMDSFQIQCFTLESPVSATLLPIRYSIAQSPQSKEKSQLSSRSQTFQLTLWDKKKQIQNFLIQPKQQKLQDKTPPTSQIIRKQDMKVHNFGIKKAYTTGNYLIVLDEDHMVTVRKEWQIKLCFTDVMDMVLYQQNSTQRILKQQQFKNSNRLCPNSIFILYQVKHSSKLNLGLKNQEVTLQLELIFLAIEESKSIQKLNNQGDIFYDSIKIDQIKQNGHSSLNKLSLSQNGHFAFSKDKIVFIDNLIYQPKVNRQSSHAEKEFKYVLTNFLFSQLNEKLESKIQRAICAKMISFQKVLIVFQGHSSQLSICSICFDKSSGKLKNIVLQRKILKQSSESNKIKLSKFDIYSDPILVFNFSQNTDNSQKPQIKYRPLMVTFLNSNIQVYETQTWNLVFQHQLSPLISSQLIKNYEIIYAEHEIVWILDQNHCTLYRLNLELMLKQKFLKPTFDQIDFKTQQLTKSHYNAVKVLNLRLKIMKLLQFYLEGNKPGHMQQNQSTSSQSNQKNPDFSSCIRLLNSQQNISIVNDGLSFLMKFIFGQFNCIQQLETNLPSSLTILSIEQALVQLLSKLVQSKYQSHVQRALSLLIKTYQFFNSNNKSKDIQNKCLYEKIAQSSRIQKLLNQEKKKKLWELAYLLVTKVQGSSQFIRK